MHRAFVSGLGDQAFTPRDVHSARDSPLLTDSLTYLLTCSLTHLLTYRIGVIAGGILGASAFVCLILVVARKMFMVRWQKDITVQKDITSAKGHYWSELKPKRAVTAPEQKVKEWEMGAQNRA